MCAPAVYSSLQLGRTSLFNISNRYFPTKGLCYSKEAHINHYMKEGNREFRTLDSGAYRVPDNLPRTRIH